MTAGGVTSDSRHWSHWLWLSAAVIALDQATKYWVLIGIRPGEEYPMTSFFSLVLAFNSGAAFSFLAGADGWQRWLFVVIALIASAVMLWLLKRGGASLFCAGIALILRGALGSLYAPRRIGRVVEFLLCDERDCQCPAFNVADSAITVGAALLIIESFRQRHEAPAPARRGEDA
jgi:signal peptidase II